MSGNGKPPWGRWYEPPRWFPAWLHLHACTFCRGMNGYVREQARERSNRVNTGDMAILFLGLSNLALIGDRVWVVHRLSERIRVAAPTKQPQTTAENAPVREIPRRAS